MGNQSSSLIRSDAYMTLSSHGDNLSSPMTIETLVARHQKHLPVAISTYRVAKTKSCNVSFREGNTLCVHFHKESEVVTVETKEGAKYVVPLRSSFMCSPLYNTKEGEGHMEGIISELWERRLPRMIFITQGYLSASGDESSSVEEGQMLAIEGLVTINRKSLLKCIDVNTNEEKLLENDCVAPFTTDPTLLKMTLENYVEYITLPVSTIFFPSSEAQSLGFPQSLVCIVTGRMIAESVIASPYSLPLSVETNEVVEILLTAPIYVCIMRLPKSEDDILKQKTRNLLGSFSPSLVAEVVANISTPIDTNIQTVLFQFIEQDIYWRREFFSKNMPVMRDAVAVDRQLTIEDKSSKNDGNDSSDDNYEDIYEVVDGHNLPLPVLPLPKDIENLKASLQQHFSSNDKPIVAEGEIEKPTQSPAHTSGSEHSYNQLQHSAGQTKVYSTSEDSSGAIYSSPREVYNQTAGRSKPVPAPKPLMKPGESHHSPVLIRPQFNNSLTPLQRHHSLGNEDKNLKLWSIKETEKLVGRNESFKESSETATDLSNSSSKNEQIPSVPTVPQQLDSNIKASQDEDMKAKNIEILQDYSVEEVLSLLDKLNLGQYKDKFAEEQITGSLLLELDEEILTDELGIKGKLHRLKLMRVIEGRQPL